MGPLPENMDDCPWEPGREKRLSHLRQRFDCLRLRLQPDDAIDRIREQAGVQLRPRLDWALKRHAGLHRHLQTKLPAPPLPWTSPVDRLDARHEEAAAEHLQKLSAIAETRYNKGKGVTPKQQEEILDREAKALFECIFLPLGASSLQEILEVGANQAYICRSRYRGVLPDLLEGFEDFLSGEGEVR
jgi:hypothetical protein